MNEYDKLALRRIARSIRSTQIRIKDKTPIMLITDNFFEYCINNDLAVISSEAKKLTTEVLNFLPHSQAVLVTEFRDQTLSEYPYDRRWKIVAVDLPQLHLEIDKLMPASPGELSFQEGLANIRRLLGRLWGDGIEVITKSTLQVVSANFVSIEDTRIQAAFRVWEHDGVIQLIGEDESYIKMLKSFY